MDNLKSGSIMKHFSNITDKRRWNKQHKLIDIITISICTAIAGQIHGNT